MGFFHCILNMFYAIVPTLQLLTRNDPLFHYENLSAVASKEVLQVKRCQSFNMFLVFIISKFVLKILLFHIVTSP